jgi:outer membrane receptor protein involved in Fe transport
VINKEKVLLPFNSKHRLMAAVSYKTKNKKWQADLNAHLNGKMRLPNTENNPEQFRRDDYSKTFGTLNVQLTRKWKKVEAYAGVENVFNYRQKNPIINSQNPFDPYFDTSFIWGPVRGREIFLGIRWMPFGQ